MELREYLTKSGINPYRKWFDNLRDTKTKARIESRLTRIELGHFGDYKSVGKGVFELRFMFGPGYRLYYGIDDERVVLLLLGGDKESQKNDIQKAQEYWSDYNG
jgi:putative addiction module killer protein